MSTPKPHRTRFGAALGDLQTGSTEQSDFTTLNTAIGPLGCARTYQVPGQLPFLQPLPVPAGQIVDRIASFRLLPSVILSGQADEAILSWLGAFERGHPVYWHEPDGGISRGLFTLPEYEAASKHFLGLCSEVSNPTLWPTLVLQDWTLDPASGRNVHDWDGLAAAYNTVAWDTYNQGSKAGTVTPVEVQLAPSLAQSAVWDHQPAYAEFGCEEAPGRPGLILDLGKLCVEAGVRFCSYWDSSSQGGTWVLSDAASAGAWRQISVTE